MASPAGDLSNSSEECHPNAMQCFAGTFLMMGCCECRQHLACKASKQRHPTPACQAGHARKAVSAMQYSAMTFLTACHARSELDLDLNKVQQVLCTISSARAEGMADIQWVSVACTCMPYSTCFSSYSRTTSKLFALPHMSQRRYNQHGVPATLSVAGTPSD
jgi:hypothetical protein